MRPDLLTRRTPRALRTVPSDPSLDRLAHPDGRGRRLLDGRGGLLSKAMRVPTQQRAGAPFSRTKEGMGWKGSQAGSQCSARLDRALGHKEAPRGTDVACVRACVL